MSSEAVQKLLATRPFEPLQVELSSGQVWTMRHPENVLVLKNTLVVTEPETDTVRWISLIHVVSISRPQKSLPA